MITIENPADYLHGLIDVITVEDEAEAAAIAAGRKSYFYRSHIITACYLFVPVEDK